MVEEVSICNVLSLSSCVLLNSNDGEDVVSEDEDVSNSPMTAKIVIIIAIANGATNMNSTMSRQPQPDFFESDDWGLFDEF